MWIGAYTVSGNRALLVELSSGCRRQLSPICRALVTILPSKRLT